MKIGESLKIDEVVYHVTKKINEYTYEICDTKNNEAIFHVIGRPIPAEWKRK